jgi:hypothetical protein
MLTYVSTVPGIGVDTDVFALWTTRMPGSDSYDTPERFCQWGWEPIECRGHPFGFDWKKHRSELSKLRNVTDTEEKDKLERPPRFRKLFNATGQHVHKAVDSETTDIGGSQRSAEDRSFGILCHPWEYLW